MDQAVPAHRRPGTDLKETMSVLGEMGAVTPRLESCFRMALEYKHLPVPGKGKRRNRPSSSLALLQPQEILKGKVSR